MIENDQITLVWDSTNVTDNRLNITIVLKDKHQEVKVDVAVSVDRIIASIEALKTKQYQDLAFEVWQIHQVEVVLAP